MVHYDVMAPVHISRIKRRAPMHQSRGMQSGSGATADLLLREWTSSVSLVSALGDTSMMHRRRLRSVTLRGDSRERMSYPRCTCAEYRPAWVVTSPPYYGLRTYGPDQWLRQWFLGGPAEGLIRCRPASNPSQSKCLHRGASCGVEERRRIRVRRCTDGGTVRRN